MDDWKFNKKPEVHTKMLIRRPIEVVFNAFVDPKVTTHFWFTKSTGKLQEGNKIKWEWEMFNVETSLRVLKLVENSVILIEWGLENNPTKVRWDFKDLGEGTYVSITNYGFSGTGDEIVAKALDSMKGFTFVLAGLKAFLEHGLELNLTKDSNPSY